MSDKRVWSINIGDIFVAAVAIFLMFKGQYVAVIAVLMYPVLAQLAHIRRLLQRAEDRQRATES